MTTVVKLAIMALLTVGFFCIFRISLTEIYLGSLEMIPKEKPKKKRPSLKKMREEIIGLTKVSIRRKMLSDAREVLRHEGREKDFENTKKLCSLLGICGVGIGILVGNYFLSPVLGALMYFIPLWIIKLRDEGYISQMAIELESTLSIITSSYIRNEDVVKAIQENIDYIEEPFSIPFKRFVTQTQYISADIVAALDDLKRSYDNEVFHEWCDIMIQCQKNRQMKAALMPTLQTFADIREVQMEYDTKMSEERKDNIVLCIGIAIALVLFCLIYPVWFGVLYQTVIGKIIISVIILAVMFNINKVIALTEPLSITKMNKEGGDK